MMHFCYSQFRSEIAHVEEFQHTQHESPVYDRRELTIKTYAQLPSLHSGAHSFLPDQNLTSESDQSSVDCCKMPSLQLLNCWTCLRIKRWKYNPHERRCSLGWSVCVCACTASCKADKQSTLWSNTHTICKNALEHPFIQTQWKIW